MTTEKYGMGPWYIATVENGTQSVSVVHTDAYKAASVMNTLHPHDDWRVSELIGPFVDLNDALCKRQPPHPLYSWEGSLLSNLRKCNDTVKYAKMKDL